MNVVQIDDSSAVITIKVVPLSNVRAHSPVSEWLQLIEYKDSFLSSPVEAEYRTLSNLIQSSLYPNILVRIKSEKGAVYLLLKPAEGHIWFNLTKYQALYYQYTVCSFSLNFNILLCYECNCHVTASVLQFELCTVPQQLCPYWLHYWTHTYHIMLVHHMPS